MRQPIASVCQPSKNKGRAVGNVLAVSHPNQPGSLRDVVYTYDRLNRQLTEKRGLVQLKTSDTAPGKKDFGEEEKGADIFRL